jgi:cobalt-zinc-cadmium efflux system protein
MFDGDQTPGAETGSSDVVEKLNQVHRRGSRALRVALGITVVFMLLELVGGLWTNSLALLADAGHMLTDAAALGLSLFAIWFTRRPATSENTYGYFRVEILTALVNGTAMLLIALIIVYESYQRIFQPEEIKSAEMLAIASAGLVANLTSAWILHSSHLENLNLRGALLHVMGDVLGSVAAIVASVSILLWQANWMDPAVSLIVSALILVAGRDSGTCQHH